LQSNKASDTQVALHDLRYISSLASEREDRAIFLLSSLIEILSHLSAPNPESVEQVQTALASAWSYQLDTETQIPQLTVLTHMLDVACSLLYGLPAQTELKQKAMEDAFKGSNWSMSADSSDVIAIPVNPVKGQPQLVSQDSRGILGMAENGKDRLMISLLNSNDTFALV
jgi:Cohesin loading factor